MQTEISTTQKLLFGWAMLGFLGTVVWYCILWGNSENSLHASALSWSYTLASAIALSWGVVTLIPSFNKPK